MPLPLPLPLPLPVPPPMPPEGLPPNGMTCGPVGAVVAPEPGTTAVVATAGAAVLTPSVEAPVVGALKKKKKRKVNGLKLFLPDCIEFSKLLLRLPLLMLDNFSEDAVIFNLIYSLHSKEKINQTRVIYCKRTI